jgi:hypothetical protein
MGHWGVLPQEHSTPPQRVHQLCHSVTSRSFSDGNLHMFYLQYLHYNRDDDPGHSKVVLGGQAAGYCPQHWRVMIMSHGASNAWRKHSKAYTASCQATVWPVPLPLPLLLPALSCQCLP